MTVPLHVAFWGFMWLLEVFLNAAVTPTQTGVGVRAQIR